MEIPFHQKVENKFRRLLVGPDSASIYLIIREIHTRANGAKHASYNGSKALKSKDF